MTKKSKLIIFYFIFLFLIALTSVALLELTILFMLNNPSVFNSHLPNFIVQYHRAHERPGIQFSKECSKYDPEVTYTLRPGTCHQISREFSVEYSVNSEGLRDDESSLDRPEIVVIGDSHAMGWGIDQQLTFTALLEKNIGKKILNTAMTSYGTVRQFKMLERVDISNIMYLIITYNSNDLRENKTYFDNNNNLPILSEDEYNKYADWHENRKKYYFGRHSYKMMRYVFFEDIYKKLTSTPKEVIPSEKKIKDEVSLFLNILQNTPVNLENIDIIVIQVNESANNNSLFVDQLNKELESEVYNNIAKSITTIDLSPMLTHDKYYLLDDHMAGTGHRVVANALQNFIQENN